MAEQEQVLIQGPGGDIIQIGRDDFEDSHYAEQQYEVVGPVPVDEEREQVMRGIEKLLGDEAEEPAE